MVASCWIFSVQPCDMQCNSSPLRQFRWQNIPELYICQDEWIWFVGIICWTLNWFICRLRFVADQILSRMTSGRFSSFLELTLRNLFYQKMCISFSGTWLSCSWMPRAVRRCYVRTAPSTCCDPAQLFFIIATHLRCLPFINTATKCLVTLPMSAGMGFQEMAYQFMCHNAQPPTCKIWQKASLCSTCFTR